MARWFHRTMMMVAVVGFLLGGCGDELDEDPTPGVGGKDPGPGPGPGPSQGIGEVVWKPCSVDKYTIECARVDVPLDWDAPEGERIEIFVRKFPSLQESSRGQFWYLVGGPGFGAVHYLSLADWYARQGWDAYLMDYRGVGASTSLDCGTLDSRPTAHCMAQLSAEWGKGLRHFSTSGAARDLGAFIEAIRKPGEQVIVVGGSYGTFVANRYLHFFPDQADAFVLKGICPPTGCSLHSEKNFNLAVRHFLEGCAEDAFCGSKIGSDPWAWTAEVLDRVDEGHCKEFHGGQGRSILGSLLSALIRERELLPVGVAALHRLDRCEPGDVEALVHLTEALWGPRETNEIDHGKMAVSNYLYLHIVLSEFWDEVIATDEYRAELAQLPFRFDGSTILELEKSWTWERYETPRHLLTWAPSSVPMLLLNGDLDYQTTVWELDGIEEAYGEAGQHFFTVPFSGHGLHDTCTTALETFFISDPHGSLPTECIDGLRAIPWEGSSTLAKNLMGSSDLWSNGTVGTMAVDPTETTPTPELAAAIERARAELRRLEREGMLPW